MLLPHIKQFEIIGIQKLKIYFYKLNITLNWLFEINIKLYFCYFQCFIFGILFDVVNSRKTMATAGLNSIMVYEVL